MIEKGDDVGGTWRDNTYPGACCDVPSQLYSFSFARNPDWSSSYSPQPEIQAYLRRIAREYGVTARTVVPHRARARRVGRRGPALAHPYVVRRGHRTDPHRRCRRPVRAAAARDRGHRRLRGRALPLRPLGPLGRPGRQAGRRDRHRRVGDPDRPRGAAGGRPPRRLPAHRPVGDPAQRPHLPDGSSGPPCAGSRPSAGSTGPASTGRTRATCRRSPGKPQPGRTRAEGRARQHPEGHQGPRAAREGDAGLPDRLQADPALQHLLPARSPPTTSTSSPTPIARVTPTAIVTADGHEHPVDVIVVATGF